MLPSLQTPQLPLLQLHGRCLPDSWPDWLPYDSTFADYTLDLVPRHLRTYADIWRDHWEGWEILLAEQNLVEEVTRFVDTILDKLSDGDFSVLMGMARAPLGGAGSVLEVGDGRWLGADPMEMLIPLELSERRMKMLGTKVGMKVRRMTRPMPPTGTRYRAVTTPGRRNVGERKCFRLWRGELGL